jgi:hypothetical protein
MPKISETTKMAQADGILKGLSKRFKPREKLTIAGTLYTTTELMAIVRGHLTVLTELRALRGALAGKVREERAIAKEMTELRAALVLFVESRFGRNPVALGDFGFRMPKKPGPKTLAGKVHGAEQLRATRDARHTMGKRQREKIKGVVGGAGTP